MGPARRSPSPPTYGAFESDDRIENNETEGLLFVEPRELGEDDPILGEPISSSTSSSTEVQEGVRKIEAISRTWTQKSLIIAYLGIFLMSTCTSLEGQTVMSLSPYATSSFSKHSLISTVLVVQNVTNAVIKPPMAKIADVFGRFEAFCISVLIYILGYVQMAASKNVQTYASAQIFYSAGSTGLQILQQVFIADSSDLLNRALFASLPDLPFLVTVWVGPMIASFILRDLTWRWGYGMWAVLLPAAFLPLALSLWLNQRKAQRLQLLRPKPWKGKGFRSLLRSTWYELDLFGLILLSAALILILVPLTLAANAKDTWHNPSIITMIVAGLAFYFSVQPYLYSYLQVVQGQSVVTAGRVTQTFAFTSTIAAVAVSFFIKYSGRYRPFVTGGCFVYIGGLILMLLTHKEGSTVTKTLIIQTIIGLGGGLVNVPVQLGVQASASHQEVAAATAMFLTALEMGGAVGSAVSGAVWTSSVPKRLRNYLPPESQKDAEEIFGKLTKALSYPLGTPTRIAINRAYEETMGTLLTIAVCVTIPLIPLSLLMKDYRLDKMAQKAKGKVIGHSDVEDDFMTRSATNTRSNPRLSRPSSRQ
ncbi:siderophore iron transporter mirC [Uncinocarpus reesii 1704]|uniref:Siderophore iron transporter mirC n=1 Tax=Uncinocarpus reesii (strain UAMH 1704) TaxID=336963 RepID=C4JDJ2_UNCRE|nr:siderophore iron transporter mirC [Uncinocarpus reesii 1704]EEP75905.1 siderophore iron transporter mirC [Uncinocarpus reesii 1704]